MRNQTSKIDELVKQKEALLLKREKNENRMHEKNSVIETQIKKLENKTYRNKVSTDAANADIDRQVNKINKLIELEKEYVNSIAVTQN